MNESIIDPIGPWSATDPCHYEPNLGPAPRILGLDPQWLRNSQFIWLQTTNNWQQTTISLPKVPLTITALGAWFWLTKVDNGIVEDASEERPEQSCGLYCLLSSASPFLPHLLPWHRGRTLFFHLREWALILTRSHNPNISSLLFGREIIVSTLCSIISSKKRPITRRFGTLTNSVFVG